MHTRYPTSPTRAGSPNKNKRGSSTPYPPYSAPPRATSHPRHKYTPTPLFSIPSGSPAIIAQYTWKSSYFLPRTRYNHCPSPQCVCARPVQLAVCSCSGLSIILDRLSISLDCIVIYVHALFHLNFCLSSQIVMTETVSKVRLVYDYKQRSELCVFGGRRSDHCFKVRIEDSPEDSRRR